MFGIWSYVAAGLAAVFIIGGATHYADSIYYNGKIDSMKAATAIADAARANASLKQFQDISKQISEAATLFTKNQSDLKSNIDTITKDLKNVQAKKPLPANCRPDSNRLRILNSAIAAANNTVSR